MTDLRFISRSQDGENLELSDSEGNNFSLRVSDTLKAAINERRLATVVDSVPHFSIKEIQARLRAGESFAEVSRISGLSFEKVERYASPILQERGWIIELAEKTSPKGTSMMLSDLVIQRLAPRGVNMNQISWNTWRLDNGTWQLVLTYPSREGQSEATWTFDSNKRTILSNDDGARWINGEEISQKSNVRGNRINDHGVLFPMEGEPPQPPRLVAVRTDSNLGEDSNNIKEISPDAKKDGVTRRISIPSWDDIMFGRGKKKDDEEEEL